MKSTRAAGIGYGSRAIFNGRGKKTVAFIFI
jgi:hypothetical protein